RRLVVVALDVTGGERIAEEVDVAVEPELRPVLGEDAPAVVDHLDDDGRARGNAEIHAGALERPGRSDAQRLVGRGEVETGLGPLRDIGDAVEVRACAALPVALRAA